MSDDLFPENFPPECPPTDADDADGNVFRIVAGPELREADLRTYAELGKLPRADPCRRHGVSVYPTLDQARHLQKLRPYLGTHVSKGSLTAQAGKMKLTSRDSGHTTWWPYRDVDRMSLFTEPVA